MEQVEQLDLFDFVADVEPIVSTGSQLTYNPPQVVLSRPGRANFRSCVSGALSGLWSVLSNLFGLVLWVNVYTVTRSYGGRENGGWYYPRFTCVSSVQDWRWNTEALRLKLFRRYSGLARGVLSAETDGVVVAVLVEWRKAAQQTRSIPSFQAGRVLGSTGQVVSHAIAPAAPICAAAAFMPFHPISEVPKQVIHKLLSFTGAVQPEQCSRCGGSGQTPWYHVDRGVCFKCRGNRQV